MSKNIVVKTGTKQDGKGIYKKVGVIMSNENGEFVLLDPNVSLSGLMAQQNVELYNLGKPLKSSVIASIFENDNDNSPHQQRQGNQQQAPRQQAPQQPPANMNFNDDVPFMRLGA